MKITGLIATMEDVLDHMTPAKYPVGRDAAEQYAQLCTDVSEKLRECGSLLQMGAFAEAKKLNLRTNPPITERAKLLDFKRRDDWQKLCEANHWAEAPELNMATVRALESPENEQKAVSTEMLLEQWHVVAREGSPREKMLLARKIYAANPDSQAWRTNLANMEGSLIPMFLEEAQKALEENRLKVVQDIYNELVSPDLLHPVHADTLEPLRKGVEKYQKMLLQEQKDKLLYDIGIATANQDLDILEQKLIEWEELKKTPNFEVTDGESVQVSEARNFLMQRQAEENKNKMFEEKQNELEYLLDNKAPANEIELVWHTLESLDMPVRSVLVTRMQDFLAAQELERRRKHIRNNIKLVAIAIATIIVVVLVVLFMEHQKLLRDNCNRMEEHIAQGHPEAAAELFVKVQKENPKLAKEPELISLNKKALEIIEQAKIDRQKFADTLNEIDKYLSEDKIEFAEVADLFDTAEAISRKVSAELQRSLTEKKAKRDELVRTVLYKRESKFIIDADALLAESRKAYTDCVKNDEYEKNTDVFDIYEKRMNQLHGFTGISENISDRLKRLVENAKIGKVSDALIEKHKKENESQLASLRAQIDRMKQQCELKRKLYLPSNTDEYLAALEELQQGKYRAMDAQFLNALMNRETWDALRKLDVTKGKLDDSDKMKTNLDTAKKANTDPYVTDLFNYTSRNSTPMGERLKSSVSTMKKRAELWKLHVITLTTQDGDAYQLYVQGTDGNAGKGCIPMVNRLRNKLVSFKLTVKTSLTKTTDVSVKVEKNKEGKLVFSIDAAYRTGVLRDLPEKFSGCSVSEQDLKDGKLPLAKHYTIFMQKLNELSIALESNAENAAKIRSVICDIFKDFADPSIIPDPYERAMCLKYWNDMLTVAIPGSQEQMKVVDSVIDNFLAEEDLLYQPCTRVTNSAKVDAFNKSLANGIAAVDNILKNVVFENVLLYQAVLHSPVPVGVIYLNPDKQSFRLRLFNSFERANDELTVRLKGQDFGLSVYAFAPEKLLAHDTSGAMKIPLTALEQPMRGIYNGQLVFRQREATPYAKFVMEVTDKSLIHWPQSWPVNVRGKGKVVPTAPKEVKTPVVNNITEEKPATDKTKETTAEQPSSGDTPQTATTTKSGE